MKLNPDFAIYRIEFRIEGAKNKTIAFRSMQLRTKERPAAGWEVISVFFACFLLTAVVGILLLGRTKESAERQKEKESLSYYLCGSIGRGIGRLLGSSRAAAGRKKYLHIIFFLLFFVSIAGNVTGWSTDGTLYRYFYLLCAILLLLAGFFCWERPLRAVSFSSPAAVSWLMLWFWIMISDFFTGSKVHFHAYVMVIAAGFFLFMWQQTEEPAVLFPIIMEALKADFYLSLIICLFFRPKYLAVQYAGIFGSAKMSAMFALLMLITFFTEIDKKIKQAPGQKYYIFPDIIGMALAFYLALRSEEPAGYLLSLLFLLLMLTRVIVCHHSYLIFMRKNAAALLFSFSIAFLAAGFFHIGIKTIPQAAGFAIQYSKEEKVSVKEKEVIAQIREFLPGEAEGLVAKEEKEAWITAKNYMRRLNLYGNARDIKVFRKSEPAPSGILALAYRYGIYVLLPLWLYLLTVLFMTADGWIRDEKKMWMHFVMLIYTVFLFCGNAELPLAHPLWLCVYLCPGYWFDSQNLRES